MPEYLTSEDKSGALAEHAIEWLTDDEAFARRTAALTKLRDRVGHGGASRRAADYLLDELALKAPAKAKAA